MHRCFHPVLDPREVDPKRKILKDHADMAAHLGELLVAHGHAARGHVRGLAAEQNVAAVGPLQSTDAAQQSGLFPEPEGPHQTHGFAALHCE
jgi:hypothetical protein